MDKAEIGSMILASNEELAREVSDEARLKAKRERMEQTHARASLLATQLLDHYEATTQRTDRYSNPPEFSRSSPFIPLGEVDPANQNGFTHGFVQVAVRYLPKSPGANEPKTRKFNWFRGTEPYEGWVASEHIAKVSVDLYSGKPDGTGLRDTADYLHTPTLFAQDMAEEMIEPYLLSAEQTVGILEVLTADVGIQVENQ